MLILFPADQAALVESGAKRQTIRKRARAPNIGTPLHLHCGRARKLIKPPPPCTAADPVDIDLGAEGAVLGVKVAGEALDPAQIAALARDGGFTSVETMGKFYAGLHGPGVFEGVLIRW